MTDPCSETLRVLGHELRRPLTVIRGASTLLVEDAEALPPESRQQMLAMIDRSAAMMSDLLDDLHAAVHLDAGDIEYFVEPVDVAGLVGEAVELARRDSPDRRVEVRGLDAGDLEVEADREQAVRALRALVANALHFSPPDALVEVVVGGEDGWLSLDVRDRGPGFPAAGRERAFEKFTRMDQHAGGAGLGLYLARGLARGMGGDVTVNDREDGGSVVCFTLRRRG